jgi:hypothetical protein
MRKLLSIVFALVVASNSWAALSITKDDVTGIVTITQSSAGELGPALRDHAQNPSISDEDYEKITSASGFELIGPFSEDPDILQLANKNSSITSLDLSRCVISSNNMQFFKIPLDWKSTLTSIDLPTDASFSYLPENFLYGFTSITEIDIPANIEEIRNGALGNLTITEITIPATVKRIKEGAFKDISSLKDVYVESRNTVCEMNAFAFETLVGQTDVALVNTCAAKLHYPDTPEDYEYFVGAWKEGATISQSNLNGFKDNYYKDGVRVGPNNGWQQFALSDRSEPYQLIQGAIRTYSDSYEHDKLPTGSDLQIRVYRATGYDNNGNVILRRVYGSPKGDNNYYNCIPANTGVVLVAYVKENGSSYLHYFERTSNNIKSYPWKWSGSNETDNSGENNLLEESVEETDVAPVWPWPKTSNVVYRNFGLIKSGNEYKWSRLTSSKMRANRAYLKMPATVFTNNNEGAEDGPGNEGLGNAKAFTMFDNGTQVLSIQGEDDDEIQYVGISFPDDEPTYDDGDQSEMCFLYANPDGGFVQSGVATRIEQVSSKSQDDYYYNLQGVRVQPRDKGVYIHKGKKIVIK